MYIFRWLMKHPVVILALYFLSIVAILYSMTGGDSDDKKASETAPMEKTELVDSSTETSPTTEKSSLTTALVGDESADSKTNEEAVSEEKTDSTEPSTDDVAKTEDVDASKTDTDDKKETEEVVATDDADKASEEAVTETETTDAENTVAEVKTEAQFAESSEEELLLMAREAYWNNGLEESAEIYQQLIKLSPDVIDYKGELGNVFWRQGFPKKAAELYAEISLPMIEEGNKDKVANMVGFIGLFYPEKATEIHNKLQAEK